MNTKNKKYDWDKVNWNLTNTQIMHKIGATWPAIEYQRIKRNNATIFKRTKSIEDKIAMEFKVESNIPFLPRGQGGFNFPFSIMNVGDSFFFNKSIKPGRVMYAAKKICPKTQWACRSVSNRNGKVIGNRIWRVG